MGMDQSLNYLRSSRERHLGDFCRYLEFPSISSLPEHASDLMDCARHTARLLVEAGLDDVKVHDLEGPPVVTGSWKKWPDRPTVLIYGHYDVQPVDPLALWHHPPFAPHVANDRVFARGATDDKGQILMHIHAVGAILKATGSLPINVVFLIEGEEEIGSPHLDAFLTTHRDLLRADLAIISDSSMWGEGMPAITTSLRGLTRLEMTVTGPQCDLHSGSFGGAIANPLEVMARMLAAVKDQGGRIQIPGFYDQVTPCPESLRNELLALPFVPDRFLKDVGVAHSWCEEGYSILECLWHRPTFEINGMWGGFIGPGSKTVLPSKAYAKISMRLVPDQSPDDIVAKTVAFFQSIAPPWVQVDIHHPKGGSPAIRFADDLPSFQAAKRALSESFQHQTYRVGEGGTIPIVAKIKDLFGIDTLLLGFGLADSRPHSPNENQHLPTFHTGTEGLVRLLHYL
ncbi:MAG: dipeptidase [Magnetococcales bacterium]|nr:dipeptidase [Magnetococcales bacterium]MBF0148500.1 dipeptidase [Magnetococcales bacterium]MBF0632564.1 dipeptidase [Magnetococcales bacterium]